MEERVHCYHKSPTKPSLVVMHNTNKEKVEENKKRSPTCSRQPCTASIYITLHVDGLLLPRYHLTFFSPCSPLESLCIISSAVSLSNVLFFFLLFLSDDLSFSLLLNNNWTSEELINVKISTFSHSKKCWPWMFTRNVSYVLKWCAHWFILLGLKYYIGVWITKNSWFWYWAGRIW